MTTLDKNLITQSQYATHIAWMYQVTYFKE